MNSPIRRLSTIVAMLFTTLLISTTYIQFVQAKSLQDRPVTPMEAVEHADRDDALARPVELV